jgi:hypothetical protein
MLAWPWRTPSIGRAAPKTRRAPMHPREEIKHRIAELQVEHRTLDELIGARLAEPVADELLLRRLKKRKLLIKDSIVLLQMQLTPDVPA